MNLKARDLDSYSVIDVRSTIRSSMILPIFLYWKTAEVSGTAVRPAPGSNVYNAFDGY